MLRFGLKKNIFNDFKITLNCYILQKKYASVIKDLRKQGNTAMKAHELAVKNAAAKAATDKKRD